MIKSNWQLTLYCLLIFCAIPGLLQLRLHPDPTVAVLPNTGPMHETYKAYLSEFPADYGALIVVKDRACTEQTWDLLNKIHGAVEQLPEVFRVVSPINAELVIGIADTVEVTKFVDIESIRTRCDALYSYKPVQNLLLNAAEHAFAISITAEQSVTAKAFSEAIEQAIKSSVSGHTPHQQVYLTGEMIMSHDLTVMTDEDTVLVLMALVLMLIIVSLFTGSLKVGLLAAVSGLSSVIITLALMGYGDIPLSPVNSLMINMLIPLGAAFTVHALYYDVSKRSYPPEALAPFSFATLTTLLGFGLSCINPSPALQSMGLLGIFGIMVNFLVVFLLVFPCLHKIRYEARDNLVLIKLGQCIHRLNNVPSGILMTLVLVLCIGTGFGVSRLTVDYSPVDYFDKQHPSRQDFDAIGDWFGRYLVPLRILGNNSPNTENTALSPEQWRILDGKFSQLKQQYPGLQIAWLHDQVLEIHQAFNSNQGRELPASSDLISQYLLLFNPDDIVHYLNNDRDQMAVILQTPFKTAHEYLALKSDLLDFAQKQGIQLSFTGRLDSFFETGQDIAWGNLKSMAWGIALLLAVFSFYLRSIKIALVVVFVNALPVLMCFAVLGLLNIPLDFGASVVATIALGLVLDDTGHLIARYRFYRRKAFPSAEAATMMVNDLRLPVLLTTITIVIGFSVMNFAQMVAFHTFSILLGAALSTACIADLILLPVLLGWADKQDSLVKQNQDEQH